MQAISPMSIRERHQNQSFGAHAKTRDEATTREIRNERILSAARHRELTAQPGSVFYNAMTTDTYQKSRSLSELNDDQLKVLSKALAAKDDKEKLSVYKAALIGIPALDTASRLATTAGSTATKLSAAGKTAGSWAGAFVLAGLYNGATNKIAAVSPVVRKFGDDHPVLASLLNLAGFGGVLYGAQKGLDLLISKSRQAFPQLAEHVKAFSSQTALKVNASKVNTKVIQPVAEQITKAATKFPKTSSVAKYALGLGAFAWASGIVFKAITDRAENKTKADNIFTQLKDARQANINSLEKLLKLDAKVTQIQTVKAAEAAMQVAKADIEEARQIKMERQPQQDTVDFSTANDIVEEDTEYASPALVECDECDDCEE